MANCPYCDCAVSGSFVIYGGEVLHKDCFDKINEDLDGVPAVSPVMEELDPFTVFKVDPSSILFDKIG